MFRYVLKDLKNELSIKLLIIFQITAVLFLSVIMVSNILSRYKLYAPINDQLSEKGVVINSANYADENNMILTNEKQLTDRLENVKNISASYVSYIEYTELGYSGYDLYSYPDELFEKMPDEFDKGGWYSDGSDTIYAAVSCNNCGIKKGDSVHIITDSGEYDIVITGVLKEGARVLGNAGTFSSSDSTAEDLYMSVYSDRYLQLYETSTDETRDYYEELLNEGDPYGERYNEPELFMSDSELSKMDISETMLFGNVFITFEDNISEETMNKNMQSLDSLTFIDNMVDMSELDSRSVYDIKSQIASLLPLIICIYILTLITALCICLISTQKMLRRYSVFYICGSSWKGLVAINIGSSSFICVISFILVLIFMLTADIFGWLSDTVIGLGLIQTAACLAIILIYILASIIVPMGILRRKTAKEILSENK